MEQELVDAVEVDQSAVDSAVLFLRTKNPDKYTYEELDRIAGRPVSGHGGWSYAACKRAESGKFRDYKGFVVNRIVMGNLLLELRDANPKHWTFPRMDVHFHFPFKSYAQRVCERALVKKAMPSPLASSLSAHVEQMGKRLEGLNREFALLKRLAEAGF